VACRWGVEPCLRRGAGTRVGVGDHVLVARIEMLFTLNALAPPEIFTQPAACSGCMVGALAEALLQTW
jgi:hypothetical protein